MAILTVTNNNDSGAGSLRWAIANASAGDTVQFNSSLAGQTVTLTSGQLVVDKNLTIDASGASGVTISGNNASRVIDISAPNSNVTLRNLAIADGRTTGNGVDGAGAGIRTAQGTTLTLEGSQLRNNTANGVGGGGLYAGYQSNTIVTNSTFEGNSTAGRGDSGQVGERGGGAIAVHSESVLSVRGSTFNANTGINGGAINSLLSTLTVEDSTFTNNDTSAGGSIGPDTRGYGGAIYTDGANPNIADTITISNSRFDSNSGAGQGGGLYLFAYSSGQDSVVVENSTVINNSVVEDTRGDALGGGVNVGGGGNFTFNNTTVASNRANQQGGGLWVGSPTTINNSTIYGNRAETADGNGGLGGGLFLPGNPSVSINSSTIADNYAGFQGGGFWKGGSATTLSNTLVSNNQANNGGNPWNIFHNTNTTYTDGGGNVEYNPFNPGDTKVIAGSTVVDPQLGAFTDNGTALQNPPVPGNDAIAAGATSSGGATATIPLAPGNLVATAASDTDIALAWQDNSNNETGFKIERSLDNANWTTVATASANSTSYTDTGLTGDTQYYYRISATNGVGDSTTVVADTTTSSAPVGGGGTDPNPPVGGGGTDPNPPIGGGGTDPNPPVGGGNPGGGSTSPILTKNASDIFQVQGGAGQLLFTLKGANTKAVNELGIFTVDDSSGTVNGIAPGQEGYLQAALSRSKTVFSALPKIFPDVRTTRQLSVDSGQQFGFFLVQNGSTDQVLADLAAGGTPDNVFFATPGANSGATDYVQVSDLGNNAFDLAWEDLFSGHRPDFDDLEVTVELTQTPPLAGTTLQGGPESELLDLTNLTGSVAAEFVVNRDAAFENYSGFYAVDDATGRLGNLNPGDAGYAEAAISQRIDPNAGLPGGKLLAPFLIADSTPEEFLEKNPTNQQGQGPNAYFAYLGANPDKVDHVRQLGDNTFGFEDLYGGGDLDYNDHIVQVNIV